MENFSDARLSWTSDHTHQTSSQLHRHCLFLLMFTVGFQLAYISYVNGLLLVNIHFHSFLMCSAADQPQIQGCPERYTGVEHNFSMDMLPCRADGSPAPTLQWYYEGNLINESEPLTRTGSGMYRAEARNVIGRSEISVEVTIECKCIKTMY